MGDAAKYLGISSAPSSGQHSFAQDLARWLSEHGDEDFTAAMHGLAAQLDADIPRLVNYQRRRQAMQEWRLDPDTWQEITNRLPPTPGPIQPVIDDRKRQAASALTWAYVTQGEPRFAPPPIEASQPDPVHKDWASRGNLWHKPPAPADSFTTPNSASSSSSTATVLQGESITESETFPAGGSQPPTPQNAVDDHGAN